MKVYIGPYNEDDREINIEIHEYDTFSMDYTLALIILPLLKQLKETTHGSPFIPNDEVPEHLHAPDDFSFDNGEVDEHWHDRWAWVLDQMIFSFESIVDDSWEDQFHSGEMDYVFEDTDDEDYVTMEEGPNHTHKFDSEGYTEYNNRIQRGLELFGKHFRDMWD